MPKAPLSGCRALDLCDEKGLFCGRILADFGAEVIQIEKLGGNSARFLGPFYHNTPDPEKSLYWSCYAANKKGITLNIESEDGRQIFKRLVKNTDILIESFDPGYLNSLGLDYASLAQINPRLIMTSITPFGQDGPYRDFKASDLICWSMGGYTWIVGEPDRPPIHFSFPQAYLNAGAEAAVATLIAYYHRLRTGEGQHADVSIQASVARNLMSGPLYWEISKVVLSRSGAYRVGLTVGAKQGIHWKCKDGYVTYLVAGGTVGLRDNTNLVEYMDSEGACPDFMKEMDWRQFDMATTNQGTIDRLAEAIGPFFEKHTMLELYQEAIKRKMTIYPAATIKEIVQDPHLADRKFWEKVTDPELGSIDYPGAPVKLSETPCASRKAAPHLGEHNDEIYVNGLGYSKETANSLETSESNMKSTQIFKGIKVLDFSWVVAGPWVVKYLADYGAEVIHVESRLHPDILRTGPPYKDGIPGPDRTAYFVNYHCNSYGITINLNHPSKKGVELVKKLVNWADVVVENFAPGIMGKWELGYEQLSKIKPGIIMLSLSQLGQSGRYSRMPGTGIQLISLSGFTNLVGYPDGEPVAIYGGYNDTGSARLAASALIAALIHRQQTGKGQYIDVSEYEAGGIHFLAPLVLDYEINGRIAHRNGNRCEYAAPHGVYPCKGEERWCAITVFTDEEWQGLCQAMGKPSLAQEPEFATLTARKRNEDELDRRIADWTRTLSREEVVGKLQSRGVPAGPVNDFRDLYEDPQLTHRGYFWEVDHPVVGKHKYESEAFKLSKTSCQLRMPAPLFGQHNAYVCTEILGILDEEFVELVNEGVLE